MSNFQIAILSIFGVILLIAVILFSGLIPGTGFSQKTEFANLVIWGTLPYDTMKDVVMEFNENKETSKLYKVSYESKKPETYEAELVNALAAGSGPDIFMISQDSLLRQQDKVYAWPYKDFPERTFKDSFVEEGELFLSPDGVVAVPHVVDPLVLYWNRDLFTERGIAKPPTTWTEFQDYTKQMTIFDVNKDIVFSGGALGEFSNVRNAKEILTLLAMQGGANIFGYSEGKLQFLWGANDKNNVSPMENAINFFGRFANPKLDTYSWNRSLNTDREMFIAGSLAMYLGFGSEFDYIKNKNPHLNFDVSLAPQIGGGRTSMTYGKMYSLAIAKNSSNIGAAMGAVLQLTGPVFSAALSNNSVYAPTRRDVISEPQEDPVRDVLNRAAVQARGWLDLDPEKTYVIFKNMIESISSGKEKERDAFASMKLKLEKLNVYGTK